MRLELNQWLHMLVDMLSISEEGVKEIFNRALFIRTSMLIVSLVQHCGFS